MSFLVPGFFLGPGKHTIGIARMFSYVWPAFGAL